MSEADSDKLNIEIQDTVDADAEKNNSSVGRVNLLLPIGMVFQFFFTVFGGGMLISGIIALCNISKSVSNIENLDKICILLIVIGSVMFLSGIAVLIILLMAVKNNCRK